MNMIVIISVVLVLVLILIALFVFKKLKQLKQDNEYQEETESLKKDLRSLFHKNCDENLENGFNVYKERMSTLEDRLEEYDLLTSAVVERDLYSEHLEQFSVKVKKEFSDTIKKITERNLYSEQHLEWTSVKIKKEFSDVIKKDIERNQALIKDIDYYISSIVLDCENKSMLLMCDTTLNIDAKNKEINKKNNELENWIFIGENDRISLYIGKEAIHTIDNKTLFWCLLDMKSVDERGCLSHEIQNEIDIEHKLMTDKIIIGYSENMGAGNKIYNSALSEEDQKELTKEIHIGSDSTEERLFNYIINNHSISQN